MAQPPANLKPKLKDTQMNNLLPELHEGHAPIALHQLFRDSLDLYDDWDGASEAPAIYHEGSLIPIAMVFGHMRGCTDILPQSRRRW